MKTAHHAFRPLRLARALVARRRSAASDLVLSTILAAIAGAANAGGFFAIGQYTSHMTGYLSQLADNLAIANLWISFISALSIAAFIAGAGFSTILIKWARQKARYQQYAWPLAIQGAFMLCFAWGGIFTTEIGRLFSLTCLCFIMGMQNATITKISGARIRTTHVTGMVTDIGIELGRWIFALLRPGSAGRADLHNLRVLLQLVLSFLVGGIVGALGYGRIGFFFSLPLAVILLAISIPSLILARPMGRPLDQPHT